MPFRKGVSVAKKSGGAAVLRQGQFEGWPAGDGGHLPRIDADAQRAGPYDFRTVGQQPHRYELDLAALAHDPGLDRERRHRHRPHQVDGEACDAHRYR